MVDALGWLLVRSTRLLRSNSKTLVTQSNFDPRSILFVQLDHLGDAVLSLPMLGRLRRRYPRAAIEVLVSPSTRELFEIAGQVDRVHVFESNRFTGSGLLRSLIAAVAWGWRLRSRRFDLAIDVRGELPHALLMWIAGARRRLGWSTGGGGFLLTHSALWVHGRSEVDSRQALLACLGIGAGQRQFDGAPNFSPSHMARHRIAARLAELDRPDEPLVVLHVGARTAAKRWPRSHWSGLVELLAARYRPRIILIGGAQDREAATEIIAGAPYSKPVDWTGQLRIDDLAALLQNADLFVGGDSGPAHLAAAVGCRVLVLFSGTNDPLQWSPHGTEVEIVRHATACSPCHRSACPWSDHPCMTRLTPESVVDALERRWPHWAARHDNRGCRIGRPRRHERERTIAVGASAENHA